MQSIRRAIIQTPLYEAIRSFRARKKLRFYSKFVTRDALCFDVGANIGDRVRIFLQLQAHVVAVEPQDECVRILRTAYGSNPRLTIVQKALGECEGEADVMISDAHVLSSLSPDWIDAVRKSGRFSEYVWDKKQVVSVTTLDKLIEQYGIPAFIKIDVEGFEYQVMKGLSRPVETLSFEFIPEFIESAFKCINHLQRLGDIRLNYSVGESMHLALKQWVTPQDMVKVLSGFIGNNRFFGDVYVQFPIQNK